ncbi:tyrosine-protein phosphatase [Streptomyces bambusae]|uniref:tyrosine-protein phosphatase n=1 Tax=Streptomyces bambusae TaxID=1550616 RepID=UPI001CFC92E9|nr:tyrosine-protein phosphatase [Streptomyces bambusae]MCB5164041.1 tyrosine-protein phosphatase [Streptomyces bambusae]
MTQDISNAPILARVRNFRDVGGLPTHDGRRVRTGHLYRSGHLAHATDSDIEYLNSLGLHTVFDFRNSEDRALEGLDVDLAGVRNVNIPLSDPAYGGGFWKMVREGAIEELRDILGEGRAAARMHGSYVKLIKERTAEHSRVVHAIAEDSVPVLMHCAAGKDRAGLSVAVTLLALGVRREAITADYLESNAPQHRYPVRRSNGLAPSPEAMELLGPLFDARAEYLDAAFAAIDETWGGVDTYLAQGLGLGAATLDRLRDRMLEPAA